MMRAPRRAPVFRAAYQIARQFTWPLVISTQNVAGVCSAAIGSLIVVNDEGWFITTHHTIEALQALENSVDRVEQFRAERLRIDSDQALDRGQRKKALRKLGQLNERESARFPVSARMPGEAGLRASAFRPDRNSPCASRHTEHMLARARSAT